MPLGNVEHENVRDGCQSLLKRLREEIFDTCTVGDVHIVNTIWSNLASFLYFEKKFEEIERMTAAGASQITDPC